MTLFSRGRRYLNLSSPNVHWDQLNVLKHCCVKVTGSSIQKTENSIRLKKCIEV